MLITISGRDITIPPIPSYSLLRDAHEGSVSVGGRFPFERAIKTNHCSIPFLVGKIAQMIQPFPF